MKYSEEEYRKIKEQDMAWAEELMNRVYADKRPFVKYKNHLPIMDLKYMLKLSCERFADEVAFYTKLQKGPYQEITYRQLYSEVNGLGQALLSHGMDGKHIAVIGETNYTWSIAYLAAVGGVGLVVPLDKELPYENLKHLVKEAEVSCVIFDKKRFATFRQMFEEGETSLEMLVQQDLYLEDGKLEENGVYSEFALVHEGQQQIENGARDYLDAQVIATEPASVIFTSGTTGMAKGIVLSHRNICSNLMTSPSICHTDNEDIFYSILPIHHTFECTCVFLEGLYSGSKIAHCEGLRYLVKNMQEIHPTRFLAVPAIAEAIHKQIWKGIRAKGKEKTVRKLIKLSKAANKFNIDLSNVLFKEIKETLGGRLDLIIVGGAAINPEILDDFNAFGIKAIQGYGLSECAPMGAINPDIRPKSHSVGTWLPTCGAMIDDPDENGVGEILLQGDNVMMGYYKNPEATADVLRDGWLYTGDLGYIDKDGYIVITGRKKNVIITKNGKNVFPEELEYQLSLFDEVAESMVFEDESENKDDTLISVSLYPDWEIIKETLGEDADNDEKVIEALWKVVDQVNNENPGYKMIRNIYLRHKPLEKNTSNKIKRFVPENRQAN